MEGISLDFHCFKALFDAFEVQFFQGFNAFKLGHVT